MEAIVCDCCKKAFNPKKNEMYLVRVNPKHTCDSYNTREVKHFDLCDKCLRKVAAFINNEGE